MSQTQLPVWIQYVQALGPMCVALVVGVIAATLTYWQFRNARDKLRLDLFEKRYNIYQEARKVLATALQQGTVSYEEVLTFARNTRGAEFLFGPEVEKYLNDLGKKLNELAYHEGLIAQGPTVADYHTHVDKSALIMNDLVEQLNTTSRLVFRSYLSFSHLN